MSHRSLHHDDTSAGPSSRSVQAIAQRELERMADHRRREDDWNPRRRMPASVSHISNVLLLGTILNCLSVQYPSPPLTNPTTNQHQSFRSSDDYHAYKGHQTPTVTNDENVHPSTNTLTTANNHTSRFNINTVYSSHASAMVNEL